SARNAGAGPRRRVRRPGPRLGLGDPGAPARPHRQAGGRGRPGGRGGSAEGIYSPREMSMDEGSLSDRERNIVEEIERNLVEEDSAFVRRIRGSGPHRDAVRLLRWSIALVVVGLVLLVAVLVHWILGLLGFVAMLL